MTHAIGLAALTVLELSPPDMVSCAVDAGFDCVGLRLIPAIAEEVQHPMIGETPLVRETERRLKQSGMRVLDIEIFRLRPDTTVADYEAALATGARLGAKQALIAGNDPDEARLTVNFAAFCELAQGYGIGANLEPMPWTDCQNFAKGVRIVEAAAHENGGVLIDPIHFDRGGSSVLDVHLAPAMAQPVAVRAAVPGAATVVDIDDREPTACEELKVEVERRRIVRSRAAVHEDDEWRQFPLRSRELGVRRRIIEAIRGSAVATRKGDELWAGEIRCQDRPKLGSRLDDRRRATGGIDADDRGRRLRRADAADDLAI